MKVLLILLFSINISFSSENCLREHLKDAIRLNKERLDKYANLTNNQSIKVSKSLIRLERLSILITAPLDWKSSRYQREGIPLLCLDFIDMDETPEFSDSLIIPSMKYSEVPRLNVKAIKKRLKTSLKVGVQSFIKVIDKEIASLEHYPNYNCMARHLFESLGRSAHLIKFYEDASRRRGLKSPKKILKRNIRLQIFSLGLFHKLDRRAASIQERGVPILCNDVPAIPLYDLSDPLN